MNPSLTAAAIAQNLIERARNLQTFKVIRQLDDRDMVFGKGPVPFDLRINKQNVMFVTVHALTLEEAQAQVDDWLRNLEEEE